LLVGEVLDPDEEEDRAVLLSQEVEAREHVSSSERAIRGDVRGGKILECLGPEMITSEALLVDPLPYRADRF
jgi:hypothetical protein